MEGGKAVTVLTYLHGVKEAQASIEAIQEEGLDIDLIEVRGRDHLRCASFLANVPAQS